MQPAPAPTQGPRHAAFGAALESLDVVVIDPSRTMQTILRSMLQAVRPRRIRIYDAAADALRDMLIEPPTVVLTDWRMRPMSGHRLIKAMKHESMAPLCFVPIVVITGHATRSAVESAFRVGAQAVMVKPLAPAALRKRLDWLVRDARAYHLDGERWAVDAVDDILDAQAEKERLPAILAELRGGEGARERAEEAQALVDRILGGETIEHVHAEAPATKRTARKDKSDSARPSATLERLLRQRAEASRPPARAEPQAKPREHPAGKSRGIWSDLWKG